MPKISILSLSKSYGGRDVLRDFCLEIDAGTRLAVVGRNGAGKSTLLRLLAGQDEPDAGRVAYPPGARVGYVAQELDETDLQTPLLSFVMAALPSWGSFWRDWDRAAKDGDENALKELSARQTRLEHELGYNPEHRAKAILSGLGFDDRQWGRELSALSGGWRERAKLARVLAAGADILLLDEPTNHLDLEAVEWLENYLLAYEGVLVFVAHDRVFLDRVATKTLFLGEAKPVVRPGSFSDFLAWREELDSRLGKQAQNIDDKIKRQMANIDRFRFKSSKARQAQSKLKSVTRLEKELEGLRDARPESGGPTLSFTLPEPERGDKTVVSAADVTFSFPGRAPLWEALTFHIYRGQKIALAGPNGSGKTTLLKLVTGNLAPHSGRVRVGTGIKIGYYSQHQTELLNPDQTVIFEMKRMAGPKASHQEVCSILGLFLLGEGYFERPVAQLSGGEKSRLLLAGLFAARANFLVLDEPTNHLDLESREALTRALIDYSGTILLVAHDRRLLAEVADEVWSVGHGGITAHLGGFEEYDRMLREQAKAASAQDQEVKTSRKDDKERKRRLAEERNAVYRELKPKKETYATLETELETALDEQHRLEAAMADPATYADRGLFSELSKKYHELGEAAENLLTRMGKLEEEIESLEARRAAIAEQ
ncbi:ABC-F family ATP-binding cassette domain-containing protein [Desulfolutivibrio sp.]|uniref:ABC-F family ATP-binding cassette domain-containing protein n=1 Tax=Desulfolutivibrio sp. TaxID=2773296 RepID=UPI002F961B46